MGISLTLRGTPAMIGTAINDWLPPDWREYYARTNQHSPIPADTYTVRGVFGRPPPGSGMWSGIHLPGEVQETQWGLFQLQLRGDGFSQLTVSAPDDAWPGFEPTWRLLSAYLVELGFMQPPGDQVTLKTQKRGASSMEDRDNWADNLCKLRTWETYCKNHVQETAAGMVGVPLSTLKGWKRRRDKLDVKGE